MYSNYLSKFPETYTPSSQQIDLIKQVENAFTSGSKFVVCSAPTGSGKSFLSKTLGNTSGECSEEFRDLIYSYKAFKIDHTGEFAHEEECLSQPRFGSLALTITKTLQDQYHDLFNDTGILKGKSNYRCKVDQSVDVDGAPCLLTPKMKEECWSKNLCPYYNARNKTLTDKFAALNYKMFLSLPGHVKHRNFIICDEASELEDELVKHFSMFIDPDKLKLLGLKVPFLLSDESDAVFKWLNNITVIIGEHVESLVSKHKSKTSSLNVADKMKLNYFKNIQHTLELISRTWSECEYICQRDGKTVKVMPLRVDTLSRYIFDYADHVLLMSATIVDHKNFAKTLGITDYKYIEVDSTFDSKKAPIYVSTRNKLNKANMVTMLPRLAAQIQDICKSHGNDKGIIHTHTLSITQYMQRYLKGDRFIYRDKETKNDAILAAHSKTTDPTVIVSPSMTFGVDLKGDLARFQIIVKAGFLPLGDIRIKRLFDEDKDWYTDKMLAGLVQACGRGVRNKDDHCVTYVLDGTISDVVLANSHKLPKYFLNRFQ